MKQLITVLALSAACLCAPAIAADAASAPMGKQQTKMAECNKDAGEMKGDERKAFMKTCLTNKKVAQQEKMKSCNADPKAKELKGDERKAFMKDCLSK
jgi:hypothetical protein